MLTNAIRAIIFDFDGVFVKSFEAGFLGFSAIRPEVDRDTFRSMFLGNFWESTKFEKPKDKEFELAEKIYSEKMLQLPIVDGMKSVLESAGKNYPLFIVTSGVAPPRRQFLKQHSLNSYFHQVLGYEHSPSKEEKFQMIFDEQDLEPDEVIFVTDTLGDVLEANNQGIQTIAVTWGCHDKETLAKGNPWKIVSTAEELAEALGIKPQSI